MADDIFDDTIPNIIPKKEETEQPPVQPIQPPMPQILQLIGLLRMDLPLIRDAHPLAIMTAAGVIPINRVMVDAMDTELKKLEAPKPNDKNKEVYFS